VIPLRWDRTEVIVDLANGAPVIVHWGEPLGDGADLGGMALALDRPLARGSPDAVAPLAVVPEHGSGFTGRPGLLGRRPGGAAWSPRFRPLSHSASEARLEAAAVDEIAGLHLSVRIELGPALVAQARLTNHGETPYLLDALTVTLPLPARAAELLMFSGRWARELQQRRLGWDEGAVTVENRRGRTSHQSPPLLFAGTGGFGEWHGEVWGFHTAWSANHSMLADRLDDGRRYVQLGELLHPGEVVLDPGQSYATPEIVAVHAPDGLTPASWGFHRHLRARPGHPTSARPVTLNTWEAVYFDHDGETLAALATAASQVGIERFVLDDGWFSSRRDDRSGLGDWWVSPDVYPDGLAPLIGHVTSLGMELGIWVEPEMVNPDSDLYRSHPEWALTTDGYRPVPQRNQLVLDLGNEAAFDHVHRSLAALLGDHDIAYLKWDMNRDHVQASGESGAPGTHAQTLAVYRLLDQLGREHPDVEIESCSSGGARIDHEILRRTRRVWASDSNDAHERQQIQRGLSMFVPPELVGAHIGPGRAHTSGRRHSLAFRAATALFGHLGVEWNLLELDEGELADLAAVIELHKRHRRLLHEGDVVRFDTEPHAVAHGVYDTGRTEGLVCWAVLASSPAAVPAPLRLPGLLAERAYRLEPVPLPGQGGGSLARQVPEWMRTGVELTGRQLAVHGIQPPVLDPDSAILVRIDSA
jgi:alpha-galactosidase